jgi:HEAT repeat protein
MNQATQKALNEFKSGSGIAVWEAAKALIKEEDAAVVPELLETMTIGKDPEKRTAAAWALGCLRAPAALEPLIRILEDNAEPPPLRDQAAESLGYIRDPKARPALIKNLNTDSADVVFSCVFALRTVGTRDDIPDLKKLLKSSLSNSYGASIAQEAREAIERIQARA